MSLMGTSRDFPGNRLPPLLSPLMVLSTQAWQLAGVMVLEGDISMQIGL